MSLNTDAILAVNTSSFSEMYVVKSQVISCVCASHTLNMTRLDLAFDDVQLNVTGMSSPELEKLLNDAINTVDTLYTSVGSVETLSRTRRCGDVQHTLDIVSGGISYAELSGSPQHPAEKLIDWKDSSLIMFDSLVAMGVPFLDNIVNILTGGTGDLSIPAISIGPKDFGQFGVLRFDLKSANVTGLNTFDTKDFYVAVPDNKNKYALDSRIELGFQTPMGLDAEIAFDWKTEDWEFNDDFIVNVDIWDLILNFTSILKVDGAALNAMALSELANKCSLTTIKYVGFDTTTSSISLGNFSMHGRCVNCTLCSSVYHSLYHSNTNTPTGTGDMPEDFNIDLIIYLK